jgi:imidazolonepropionase-like amidohydrolase
MTIAEVDAIVAIAREGRLAIAAHAINRAGVDAALRAGVRQLAHTPVVSREQAALLARSDVCISTTMTTLSGGQARAELERSFRDLQAAGVRLVLGTDAGVLPHGRNADELKTLVTLGMTPLQAIRAATSEAATCLRLPDYGDLRPGASADLIAVSGDPLSDLAVVSQPLIVIKRGRVIRQP